MQRLPLHPSLRLVARLAAGALVAAGASAHAFVIGVSEGVSYDVSDAQVTARFEPIAEVLSKALKQPAAE